MEIFYLEREKKIKADHKKKLEKEAYVNECIRKLEVEQDNKKKEFILKENKRNLILKSIDIEKTKKSMNTTKKNMDKFLLTEQNRQKLEETEKEKIDKMNQVREQKEKVYIKKKLEEEKESLKKREEEKIKNIEKARNIARMQRQQEYKNQLRMEELNIKEQKIEDFKKHCEKINQQKAQAAIKFQRQKEEVIKKFDNLMKQHKEIEAETIKELFPDDEELYNKIKEMKEKQKQEEEKMKKSRASTARKAEDENAKNEKEE